MESVLHIYVHILDMTYILCCFQICGIGSIRRVLDNGGLAIAEKCDKTALPIVRHYIPIKITANFCTMSTRLKSNFKKSVVAI